MTDYTDVLDGLHTRFATVSGINNFLKYEPDTIQKPPVLYSLFSGVEVSEVGQLYIRRFRILHRLVFSWQDNEQAELDLIPFVDSIPKSVEQDPRLGGTITRGLAHVIEGRGGFVTIGGTVYRVIDFISETVVKRSISRTA